MKIVVNGKEYGMIKEEFYDERRGRYVEWLVITEDELMPVNEFLRKMT